MGGKSSKNFVKKLDEREVTKIKALYDELSAPSKGKGIDEETFTQLVSFPPPISTHAFRVFDHKKHGLISQEDFMNGIALCARASEKDRVKALFRFFDHDDDKHIDKQHVRSILIVAAASDLWVTKAATDSKPPSQLVRNLMDMGFPRDLCEQAANSTKNAGVDPAINWILTNKPNAEIEVQDIVDAMFEGSSDGVLSWSRFNKWALGSKRPPRFAILLNAISGIYVHAAQYIAPVKTAASVVHSANGNKPLDLIDFSIEDTEAKPEKDKKHRRSLSLRLKRGSSHGNLSIADPNMFQEPIPQAKTPPLTPLRSHSSTDTSNTKPTSPTSSHPQSVVGAQSISAVDLTPPPSFSVPPTENSAKPFTLALPTPIKRPRSVTTSAASGTPLSFSFSIPTDSNSSKSSLDASQKSITNSEDGWSDSDEEGQEGNGKSAIKVVIKERSDVQSADVDLKKFVSQLSLDVPKTKVYGNSIGRNRGHRNSSRLTVGDTMFEKSRELVVGNGIRAESPRNLTSTPNPTPTNTSNNVSQNTSQKDGEDDWFTLRSSQATTQVKTEQIPPKLSTSPTATTSQLAIPTKTLTPPLSRSITSPAFQKPQIQEIVEVNPRPSTVNTPLDPSECMRIAMSLLEKGSFSEAMENVNNSIHAFLSKPDPQSVKGETNFCVAYKVALGLLIDIRETESALASQFGPNTEDLSKMALRSKFLTEIPLKPNHRTVCVRMAINKNIQAKNYGVAARLLEALLLKGAPDREALQVKLRKCKEEANEDLSLPPYMCPLCNQACSAAVLKCSCGRPVRWCFKTFELIFEKQYTQCNFCNAIFSAKVYGPEERCSCCFYGKLQPRE